jgi:hypothetical protein
MLRPICSALLCSGFLLLACSRKAEPVPSKPPVPAQPASKSAQPAPEPLKAAEPDAGLTDLERSASVQGAPRHLNAEELPPEIKLRGTFLDAIQYRDAQGEHVVAFTRLLDEDRGNVQLEAQLWSGKDGKGRIERTVKDGEKNCEFDLFAEFLDAALGVSDLDHDGQAELTLAYRMTCTSDVSPWTLKLLVLEGNDKYALRGSTRVDVGGGEQVGGEHEADAALKKNPVLLAHAESVWKRVVGP